MQAHDVARLGIARVFQQSLIFGKLSVLDNVFVGCHKAYRTPAVAAGTPDAWCAS